MTTATALTSPRSDCIAATKICSLAQNPPVSGRPIRLSRQTAIITAINANREQKKSEIDQKYIKPIVEYTIEDALIDAQEYHYRCGFYHGVSLVTKAVERQDQSSRAKLLARIDALRAEYAKAATVADPAHKASQTGKLAKDLEELQSQLKIAID